MLVCVPVHRWAIVVLRGVRIGLFEMMTFEQGPKRGEGVSRVDLEGV